MFQTELKISLCINFQLFQPDNLKFPATVPVSVGSVWRSNWGHWILGSLIWWSHKHKRCAVLVTLAKNDQCTNNFFNTCLLPESMMLWSPSRGSLESASFVGVLPRRSVDFSRAIWHSTIDSLQIWDIFLFSRASLLARSDFTCHSVLSVSGRTP